LRRRVDLPGKVALRHERDLKKRGALRQMMMIGEAPRRFLLEAVRSDACLLMNS
jgi:hypothetical protein